MSIEQQPPKSSKIEISDMPSLDRTVIPPREHRDKKLGWKKPAAAVALLGAIAAGAFGAKAMGGGNETETPRSEPSASASVEPGGEDPQATEKPSDGVEQVTEPSLVSVEQYKTPAEAAEALEKLRLEFINGNSAFTAYYKESGTMNTEQYIDAYLSAIFGSTDRSNPMIERTLYLEDYYEATNSGLQNAHRLGYIDDVQYRLELTDMNIIGVDGKTVTYDPSYKVNTEEIPVDYRDKNIDASDDESHNVVTVDLKQQDGHWIMASTN